MTRENKLALIVGFSLLLVVAILLADHLSPAQQGEMATLEPSNAAAPDITLPPGSGDPYRRQFGSETSLVEANRLANREVTLFGQPQGLIQTESPVGGGVAPPERGTNHPDPDLDSSRAERFEQERSGVGDQREVIDMRGATGPILPAPRDDRAGATRYLIKDGDTLYGLCRRYYSDGSLHEALKKFNADVVPASRRLQIGMTLLIPSREVLMGGTSPSPVREQAAPAPSAAPAQNVKTTDYTIREDDRLWDIAKKHLGKGGRWQEIVALNRDIIKNPDVLPIGKTIRIPAR